MLQGSIPETPVYVFDMLLHFRGQSQLPFHCLAILVSAGPTDCNKFLWIFVVSSCLTVAILKLKWQGAACSAPLQACTLHLLMITRV